MDRLSKKVIAVTGATKGIGYGIAKALAREGANVVIGGRSQQAGEMLVNHIASVYEKESLFVQGDVRDETYCKRLIDQAVQRFGHLDGLVNNAGIFPQVSFFDSTAELFDQVYEVNIRGAFLCSKYAVQRMIDSGGSIVHIGSTHAFGACAHYAAYGTSKGALYSLHQYLSENYAKNQIRSNWITVGWVATEGEKKRIEEEGHGLQWLNQTAREMCPLGGLQTEEDIAMGTIYLLSDESRMVTGTDLRITGGFKPDH